jgi:toxin ParE1/3/4
MRIIWSDFAKSCLKDIFNYHKEKVSLKIAIEIKNSIFLSSEQLILMPESGQIESNLLSLNQNHRYLISGNYKILYRIVNDDILISDIFDCRREPSKMNLKKR